MLQCFIQVTNAMHCVVSEGAVEERKCYITVLMVYGIEL